MSINIKTGQVIVFSHGEYSDYSYMLVGRALRDFTDADMEPIANQFKSEEVYKFDDYAFIAELFKAGFFEEIHATEIHVASYSTYEPSDYGTVSKVDLEKGKYK